MPYQTRGRSRAVRPYYATSVTPPQSRSRSAAAVGRTTISPTMANLIKSTARLAINSLVNQRKAKPVYTPKKAASAAKRSGRTSLTSTVGSSYSKFPKNKKINHTDDYAKYGSEIQIENRGSVSSAETVYLGHANVAYRRLFQAVTRAMIKQLFRQDGMDILSWSTFPNPGGAAQTWYIVYEYYMTANSNTTTTASISFASKTTSFSAIALLLSDAIEAVVGTSPNIPKTLTLNKGPSPNNVDVIILHMQDFKLDFELTSKLVVQNVTLAGLSATPDANDDEETNVSNNPLKCRIYHSKNANGFQESFKPTIISGTYLSFIAHPTTGLIQGDYSQNPTALTKLPYAKFFKKTTSGASAVIAPGAIKSSYLKFTKSMYFQTFLNMFQTSISLNSDTNPMPINLGNAELIGFEKVLQSAGENPINVTWELNQIIKCKSRYNKSIKSLPILESN